LWLTIGAAALGLGIWAMHFTAMTAYHLPVSVHYHLPTVALSIVIAVAAAGIALRLVTGADLSAGGALLGSGVIGTGIAAMHYTGMFAMRLPAVPQWNVTLVAVSILVAVGVAFSAVHLAFRLRDQAVWAPRRLGGTILMGLAIPVMHYTAMAAVTYHASPTAVDPALGPIARTLSLPGVVGATFLIYAISAVTSLLDRRFAAQAMALKAALEDVWEQIECYLLDHSEAQFSHGLCPSCVAPFEK
jgi:NO-binding membrane sensor protein with MHYT domain